MDRRDVEPGDGLHGNHARLRQLLRGALCRTMARRARTPLRAGLRPPPLAVAARPAGALAQTAHDLRQFDERPVPQTRAARLHRRRFRPDGNDGPPHLSGPDETELAHAGLPAPHISRRGGAGTHLVRRIGRGPPGPGQNPASASGAGGGPLSVDRATPGSRGRHRPRRHIPGSSWAARAVRTRVRCVTNGFAISATSASARMCRSFSSSGAGERPKPAAASSKASSTTRYRAMHGRSIRKGLSVRQETYA